MQFFKKCNYTSQRRTRALIGQIGSDDECGGGAESLGRGARKWQEVSSPVEQLQMNTFVLFNL